MGRATNLKNLYLCRRQMINKQICFIIYCMLLNFINRCVRAPLTYIADLRAINFKQYLLVGTNFSPSYPIMIFTGLAFTLMYCAILMYFVFTSKYSQACYSEVNGAAYLIAVLYPLETILCFICLTGSIALSKSNCWKVIMMLLFGPILSGFGFGEVGFIQLCLLSGNHQGFSVPFIFSQAGFVDLMVYLYISFLALYIVLVPSISYLYRRQNDAIAEAAVAASSKPKQKKLQLQSDKKEQQKGSSCCSKVVTVLYYVCNIFFVFAAVYIILIKLIGPILFTYVWIKIGVNVNDFNTSMERFMFAGLILAYFGPLASMFFTLAVQRLVKLGKGKKDGQGESSKGKDKDSSVRSTWQPNAEMEQGIKSEMDQGIKSQKGTDRKMSSSRRSSQASSKDKTAAALQNEKVKVQLGEESKRTGLL